MKRLFLVPVVAGLLASAGGAWAGTEMVAPQQDQISAAQGSSGYWVPAPSPGYPPYYAGPPPGYYYNPGPVYYGYGPGFYGPPVGVFFGFGFHGGHHR
jgi:hypothetical protein